MIKGFKKMALATLLAAPIALPSSPVALAQNTDKPLLLVTIAPLDRTLKDVAYISRAAGAAEVAGLMNGMVNVYTTGVDRSKPVGIAVNLDANQQPTAVAFLPVSDHQAFLDQLKVFGELDDLGNGMYAMSVGPQSVFALHKSGWLYIAQSEEHLKNVPADPSQLVGKLPEFYDLSFRIDLQSIPESMKDMLLGQIRAGFEQTMAAQAAQQTPEQRAAAEAAGKQQIEQIEQLFRETKEAVIGWAVDSTNKQTHLDFGAQFVDGSNLEKQVAGLSNLKTQFPAFQSQEFPANVRATSVVTPEDAKNVVTSMNLAWDGMFKQLQSQGAKDSDMEQVKQLIKPIREVIESTIQEGVLDGGAVLSVDGNLSVLGGGRVSDGKKLADAVKAAYAKAPKSDPNVPKIQFDAMNHKGVTFHTGSFKLPPQANDEAKKVLGEEVKFVIGTADKAAYFAMGKDASDRLKAFLDQNATAKVEKTTPMEMHVDLLPILTFVNNVQPNKAVQDMTTKLQEFSSSDSVSVSSQVLSKGLRYRFAIEEGVLRAIGEAAKSNSGNRGRGF